LAPRLKSPVPSPQSPGTAKREARARQKRESAIAQALFAFVWAAIIVVASTIGALRPNFEFGELLTPYIAATAIAAGAFTFVGTVNLRRPDKRPRVLVWVAWPIAIVVGLLWLFWFLLVMGSD
jgi:hypothetical protein